MRATMLPTDSWVFTLVWAYLGDQEGREEAVKGVNMNIVCVCMCVCVCVCVCVCMLPPHDLLVEAGTVWFFLDIYLSPSSNIMTGNDS